MRFGAWERERQTAHAGEDLSRAMAWLADAWELASRHSRWWNSRESAEEHWRHLREIQKRLERSRLGP
jgi:hypothetical protein